MAQRLVSVNQSFALFAVLLVGCAASTDLGGDDDIQMQQESIQYGEVVQPGWNTAQIDVGMFWYPDPNFPRLPSCSATLVRNNVVLTAGHCFHIWYPPGGEQCQQQPGCPPPTSQPEEFIVRQTSTGAEMGAWPGEYQQHADSDVAMFKTDGAFAVNGSTLGHSTQLYGGDGSALIGDGMDHSGWGDNVCINNPGGGYTTSGAGTQRRERNTKVVSINQGPGEAYIRFNASSSSNPTWTQSLHVDSGSSFRDPSFTPFWNQPIVGVTSWVGPSGTQYCPTETYITNTNVFRAWAQMTLMNWSDSFNSVLGPEFEGIFPAKVDLGWGTPNWVPGATEGVTQTNDVYGAIAVGTTNGVHGDAVLQTFASSTDNDWQGLVGRYRDNCNYYVFEVREQTQTARIRRVRNCSSTTLQSASVSGFDWGTGHLIALIFMDTVIGGFVDNYLLLFVDDFGHNAITAGQPGLWNYVQRNAYYENFSIQQ